MPELLSLPNELIQQIASYLPCSSALNLLRVNHKLRNVCNDRLVFLEILKQDLEYVPRSRWYKYINQLPGSENESIPAPNSLDETIRLAFAEEKCDQASTAEDDAWALKTSKQSGAFDVLDWLPQMLVLESTLR